MNIIHRTQKSSDLTCQRGVQCSKFGCESLSGGGEVDNVLKSRGPEELEGRPIPHPQAPKRQKRNIAVKRAPQEACARRLR